MDKSGPLVLDAWSHPAGTRVLVDGTRGNNGCPWEGTISEWSKGGRVRVGGAWYEPDMIAVLEILPPRADGQVQS